MRRNLTYSNVTATLALIFAMSGGALAASGVLITRTGQIAPSVRHALHGARGADGLPGAPGNEGARGERGPTGPGGNTILVTQEGPRGATGAQGARGPIGSVRESADMRSKTVAVVAKTAGEIVQAQVACFGSPTQPSLPIGGGFRKSGPVEVVEAMPDLTNESYDVQAMTTGSGAVSVTAFALCNKEGNP
jgi:hypothetical protein